jgi:ketosteroid isomerase-like protein
MTPEETKATLVSLYDALARRDGATMAALYAPDATFEDEVFALRGADIGKMWIALTRRAKEFSVSYTVAKAGSGVGTVEWTARYLYGGKNQVVNVILSELTLADGKIVRQVDTFDFPRWASQALGLPGVLFGGFGWFRRTVSKKAAEGIGVPAKR